jgi:hypothetical protein
MITEARSSVALENLQEILNASGTSVAHTLRKSQGQYFTPDWFARLMSDLLPERRVVVFDPQFGRGALARSAMQYDSKLFGVELDNRLRADNSIVLTASCVDVWDLLDRYYPDLTFRIQVANPPFGLRWKAGDKTVESEAYTFEQMLRRAGDTGAGYFIAGKNTIERLKLQACPYVYLYQTFPVGIFDADVEIGVLHF